MADFNLNAFLEGVANDELEQVANYVVQELKNTLKAQGHSLTGDLENSLNGVVAPVANGFRMMFYYEQYGTAVDSGVKKEKIPYNPGSGAKTSKYIEGLIEYAKKRFNISGDKEAKRAAFAIATKHKEDGMSTIKSKEHSSTGKRNNWVDNTLEGIDAELTKKINEIIWHIYDDMIFNAVKTYGDKTT